MIILSQSEARTLVTDGSIEKCFLTSSWENLHLYIITFGILKKFFNFWPLRVAPKSKKCNCATKRARVWRLFQYFSSNMTRFLTRAWLISDWCEYLFLSDTIRACKCLKWVEVMTFWLATLCEICYFRGRDHSRWRKFKFSCEIKFSFLCRQLRCYLIIKTHTTSQHSILNEKILNVGRKKKVYLPEFDKCLQRIKRCINKHTIIRVFTPMNTLFVP